MLIVGGAHKRSRDTNLMVLGTIFWGAFICVSNDFSEKKRDLKLVSQCPFNSPKITNSENTKCVEPLGSGGGGLLAAHIFLACILRLFNC